MRLAETEVPYWSIASLAAGDHGVAIEAQVVVGGEVEVCAAVDNGLGSAARLVASVEGVGEIEALGHFAMLDHRSVAGEVAEAARGLVNAAQENDPPV